jgi:transcription initiation factor TFIID subunit 9B
LELAQEKNKQPLPLIPEKYGIRLPADKHCLTGINFSIVPDVSIIIKTKSKVALIFSL